MGHEAVKFIVFDYYSDRGKSADNHTNFPFSNKSSRTPGKFAPPQ
jgi:hypothetical protein